MNKGKSKEKSILKLKKHASQHLKKTESNKKKWEKILNDPESKRMAKKAWSSKDPQNAFNKGIKSLAKKVKFKN